MDNEKMYQFNPYTPEFYVDPYPILDELRSKAPVYKSRGYRGDLIVLSRYEDVREVLLDSRFEVEDLPKDLKNKGYLAKEPEKFELASGVIGSWLFFLNALEHPRTRRALTKAFLPNSVKQLAATIDSIADSLLHEPKKHGRLELMDDFALRLPTLTMAAMLGMPIKNKTQFFQWATMLFKIFERPQPIGTYEDIVRASEEFSHYMQEILQEKRQNLQDDLLSNLLRYEDEEGPLSQAHIISICAMLFSVGHETAGNAIANGVLSLICNPAELDRLRSGDVSIASATEELIRFDTPTQFIVREAQEDVQLFGYELPKGASVYLCLAAANRDPAQFEQPNQLDLARVMNNNLPFAAGRHFCLGAALARMEMQSAIKALVQLPNLRPVTADIVRRRSIIIRGFRKFPLTFSASC
ncbi:hypothetical protein A5320_02695 [Rheinheimera sp. SA_1]|uniref:cytochrome P450 n=1 Tax=Rheinheimera sp. SA_1 TaxID=1827365 RepID=UPI0007FCCFDD|nr:cytochrome P450 [Rheinheimera sp. SA_1]OBP16336.1 hypothetical protein A5320_02695 [Rheinheimera sp. SA_1]